MKILKQFGAWFEDRTGIYAAMKPMMDHLVPPDSRWTYVFGSATFFMFILQIVTGVALSLLYQPSSTTAYKSLQFITNEAPLGNILRGIHNFGSSAMILMIGLHMIRVYLMAAYKYPREMSWISGVILLPLTISMGFTGQLLRWDSTGVWSSVIAAEQMGRIPFIGTHVAHFLLAGNTVGDATLSRFFSFHVFLIPALLFIMIGLHVFLVLKNGISEPPKAGRPVDPKTYRKWYHDMLEEKGVPFWPDAAWRDILFGLLVVVAVILLAIFVGPPEIGAPPSLSNIDANPRPDWYFLWVFAIFALMPPAIENFVMAFGPVVIGLGLFLLPVFFNKGERSPLRRPWAIAIVVMTLTMIATFWYAGAKSNWSPNFDAKALTPEIIGDVSPEAQEGAKLFSSMACIYCHTISGHGGHNGPELTEIGHSLNKDQLTLKIVNGGGNMPAFGGVLTDQELKDLVAFLQTREKPASPALPEK